jgi:hypothetical protein
MRAVGIHRFGSPEVVVVEDIPKPSPGEGVCCVAREGRDRCFAPTGLRAEGRCSQDCASLVLG